MSGKKNTASLHNWFLLVYPDYECIKRDCLPEMLYKYFALPTAEEPICLYGSTFNDSRADRETTEFTDGHKIITGDLISFTPTRAETMRTVYSLYSINPRYAEWLKAQGYVL